MNRKFDRNQWVVEIFCVVFILANVGLFIHGLLERDRARRSPAWPTVKGTVITSSVDGGSCDVLYTYQIDSRTFTGNHVGFGEMEMMSDRDDADRVARRYPEGLVVDVYYDPADPEISVLEPGVRPGTYNELIIPVMLALMAIGFWLLHHRMTRPADRAGSDFRSKGTDKHE